MIVRSRCVLLLLLFALAISAPAADDPEKGDPKKPKILRVNSGDTFDVFMNGRRRRVHLSGIDAPEPGQQLAEDSRKQLVALLNDDRIRFDDASGDELTRVRKTIKKLEAIVIKKVEFDDFTVGQVLAHLQKLAKTADPDGTGVKIILRDDPETVPFDDDWDDDDDWEDDDDDDDDVWGEDDDDDDDDDYVEPTFSASLKNIPLGRAVELAAEMAKMRCVVDAEGVSLYLNNLPFEEIPAGFHASVYSPKQGYSVSYVMIRSGYAWFRESADMPADTVKELRRAEMLARRDRVGIWRLRNRPMAPWRWRERYSRATTQSRSVADN